MGHRARRTAPGNPLADPQPQLCVAQRAIWVAPRDAVRLDVGNGELAELDLGIREPGGSVGLCHNAALPLPLGAQWFSAVLREVAAELH